MPSAAMFVYMTCHTRCLTTLESDYNCQLLKEGSVAWCYISAVGLLYPGAYVTARRQDIALRIALLRV